MKPSSGSLVLKLIRSNSFNPFMMKYIRQILPALIMLMLFSCSQKEDGTHSHGDGSADHSHDQTKETFSIENLVEEIKTVPDSIIEYLHAQHHSHKVLERRTAPSGYETKNLKY